MKHPPTSSNPIHKNPDMVLIGAGVMSATLGMLLKELEPDLTIMIFEQLPEVAKESSDAWNNAGTGHSAFCELNYTPQKADGSIDISKAIKIAASFEESKEFWSYLVEQGDISRGDFIHRVPHMSFVHGDSNISYLEKRYAALKQHPLFEDMQFSYEWNDLAKWMPLVMEGRSKAEPVAATRMEIGTDVDFGALTRTIFMHLDALAGVDLHLNHEVRDIERADDGKWDLTVYNNVTHEKTHLKTGFVFIGAGGGSLPLLEKSDIEEAEGFAGFPVSGQWLRCTNQEVIDRHAGKVYGMPAVGSPPMSVPHLDTRMIGGKRALLFGPYAGITTKFLKTGSYWDLARSLEFDNIFPMLSAGLHNIPLTKYLIHQAMQTPEDRLEELKVFMPEARLEDWVLAEAGKRVQVIKADEKEGGVLEFGTEIVTAGDGSLAALLGASPGASTSVSIMLQVIQRCFKEKITTDKWQTKLKQMIPSYGQSLTANEGLALAMRARTSKVLGLV